MRCTHTLKIHQKLFQCVKILINVKLTAWRYSMNAKTNLCGGWRARPHLWVVKWKIRSLKDEWFITCGIELFSTSLNFANRSLQGFSIRTMHAVLWIYRIAELNITVWINPTFIHTFVHSNWHNICYIINTIFRSHKNVCQFLHQSVCHK